MIIIILKNLQKQNTKPSNQNEKYFVFQSTPTTLLLDYIY
jgi:hypothetical protein